MDKFSLKCKWAVGVLAAVFVLIIAVRGAVAIFA